MKRPIIFILFLCLCSATANAQYQLVQRPKRTFDHKVGAVWTMITNNGYWGNTYSEPNWEWPGGSGNVYGWRTSLWIGALVGGTGYTSYGDGNHFVPLDSISVKRKADGALSAEDTYSRFTDVNPPSPTGVHKNLGVEVTERTYAWDQSYNGDFVISDYWIKNIGDDRNKDGVIDTTFTLSGIYVGFRMDCDVSGFEGSSTDSYLWDTDDHAAYDSTNKVVYLYDGDSPYVPGDDTGNPDPVTGVLRSPGYIGIRMLKYDSTHFNGVYNGYPTMATPSFRYQEPTSSTLIYDFMKNQGTHFVDTMTRDYRAIMAVGPFTLLPGDSMRIAVAWVIGYGQKGLRLNSQVAQSLFDGNYSKAPAAPDEPQFVLRTTQVSNAPAIAVQWRKNAETSVDPLTAEMDFDGYAIYRTTHQDAGGNPIWDTLAVYVKNDALNPKTDSIWIGRPFLKSWPPQTIWTGVDSVYQLITPSVLNGMIYTYAVTAFDRGDSLLGLGRLQNQIGLGRNSTLVYMSNAAPAANAATVRVVPNPFMGSSAFNNPNPIDTNPWVNRIRFVNLPLDAKVSIFTLAGDLVKVIHGGDIVYSSVAASITGDFRGVAEWDLTTRNNQEVVSGLYLYVVESPSGTHTGKFVIMR